MLYIKVITLFPNLFPGPLGESIIGKALQEKKWHLEIINLKDFGEGKRKTVDDTPYGGGAGMILRADILDKALNFAMKNRKDNYMVILSFTKRRVIITKKNH